MTKKEKYCSTCRETKGIAAFSKNRTTKDGLASRCKACMKAYRQSDKGRASKRKSDRRYRKTEKGKANIRRWGASFRHRYPEKKKARQAVYLAVQAGRLPRASTKRCADCGGKAEQYHHPDYSKPLVVVALCRKCHRKRHGL